MRKNLSRRDAVKGLGAAAMVGLAGCSGGGDDTETTEGGSGGDDGDATATDTATTTATETETATETSGSTDSFEYTISSNDNVSGSSLTGLRMNYPDGSGAVSDASITTATLGGEDVSGDLDSTSTSNNGSTLTATFGGSFQLSTDDTLVVELSNVAQPDGSYTVETVINPQSGGTSFETSF